MPQVQSFTPVIGQNPRILILGSMPGIASLNAQQYYAHPRNTFWPILSELLGVNWAPVYAQRIAQLKTFPIVLWDVLQSCQREGSLDANIAQDSYRPNDIPGLLKDYQDIHLIVFNGATAEKYFIQSVADNLENLDRYRRVKLPSTSPAHASKNLQQKLEDWRVIADYLQ